MRISPKGLAAVAAAVPLGFLGAGTALAAPAHSASRYQATTVLSGPAGASASASGISAASATG
jgi:hypothetical protein